MKKLSLPYVIWLIVAINIFAFVWRKVFGGQQQASLDEAQVLFAQWEYQEFVESTSNNTDTYGDLVYRRALSFLRLGRFEEAQASALDSYKVLKSNVNVGLMKSLWLFLKGDYESVELTIKSLWSPNLFEQSAINLFRWINFYHQWNVANATKFINTSLQTDAISPIWYHYLGRIHFDQSKRDIALNNFSKASAQGYDSLDQQLYLAHTYYKIGRVEEAELLLTSMGDIDVDSLENPSVYYSTLALIAKEQDDSSNAIAAYVNAIEAEPENQTLYTQLWRLYLENDDLENALLVFQEWWSFDETNTDIQQILWCYYPNSWKNSHHQSWKYCLNLSKKRYASPKPPDSSSYFSRSCFISRSRSIAADYADARSQEREQALQDYLNEESSLDEVFVEFIAWEDSLAYESRLEVARQAARTAWEDNAPIFDALQDDKEALMLTRLVNAYVNGQRDTKIQSELSWLDFRFGQDDFLYAQAHNLLWTSYDLLVPYYDHVDTLFIKE